MTKHGTKEWFAQQRRVCSDTPSVHHVVHSRPHRLITDGVSAFITVLLGTFDLRVEMVVFKVTLLESCSIVGAMATPAPVSALFLETPKDGTSTCSKSDCKHAPNMWPISGHQVVLEVDS